MRTKSPIKKGVDEIKELTNSYIELFKIKSIRKTVDISAKTAYAFFLIALAIIGLSFFGIALGFYIGELLNSYSLGFLVAGAIPLFLLLIAVLFKKRMQSCLLNFFTRISSRKE